jgi:hypothetical protein
VNGVGGWAGWEGLSAIDLRTELDALLARLDKIPAPSIAFQVRSASDKASNHDLRLSVACSEDIPIAEQNAKSSE